MSATTSTPPIINRNSTGGRDKTPKQHALLCRECANAEDAIRSIVQQNFAESSGGPPSLDESPLKPWIIEMAKTLIVYKASSAAFGFASLTGEGVMLKRLPSSHPSLVKWSAPLFLKIGAKGGGLLFGSQSKSTFAVCTTTQLEDALLGPGKTGSRPLRGIEFAMSCGKGLSEKTDIISVPFGEELDLVSISQTHGPILGFAWLGGTLSVDREKNMEIYGEGIDARDILSSSREPPPEFQPVYGELNRIVNRVEKVSMNAARVSASLERFSTGRDPERVLVLEDGSVQRDE
jgi:lipid-binding SYLF domain-containing protein